MNLRWKEFERRVRLPLRARIEQSPADWEEYRRYGWWQKLTQTVHLPGWTLRILLLPMAAGALSSGLRASSILVSAILIWVVLAVIWRLGQLTVALRTSPRLLVFGHLPMSDTEIFVQQWKAYLASTIGSVLDFALLYCLLAVAAGCGWGSPWIGLVFAVAQWLVMLSVAVIFVTYFWNRRFMGPVLQLLSFRWGRTKLPGHLGGAGRLLLVAAVVFVLGYGRRSLADWAVVVPPLGLAHEGLGLGRSRSLAQVWTAFSLGGTLMLLPLAYRRLKAAYRLPEGLVAGEQERGEVEVVRRREVSDDTGDSCAGIKAAIRRREFLQEANWRKAGWLEGFTARCFTQPERTAAEFLFAGTPGWTRVLKRVLVVGVLCAIGWYFVPGVFQAAGLFIPFLMIGFAARKNPDLSWPGARTRTVSGSSIAMHFLYPIGFWRVTLINLKVRLAHLGLLLVILGASGAALLFLDDPRLNPDTAYYAGLILILVLSLTALAPLFQISQGTNDASRFRVIALALLLASLFIALTVTMFAVGGGWGYLAGMGLLFTSCGGLVLYGHAYNHGWFDAQRKPQTSFKLSPPVGRFAEQGGEKTELQVWCPGPPGPVAMITSASLSSVRVVGCIRVRPSPRPCPYCRVRHSTHLVARVRRLVVRPRAVQRACAFVLPARNRAFAPCGKCSQFLRRRLDSTTSAPRACNLRRASDS